MLVRYFMMLFAFQFQSPGAELLHLGPLTVRWYGFLIAMAVLLGVNLSQYLAKARNVDPELIGDLGIWLVIAAIPCARLYYVCFNGKTIANIHKILSLFGKVALPFMGQS